MSKTVLVFPAILTVPMTASNKTFVCPQCGAERTQVNPAEPCPGCLLKLASDRADSAVEEAVSPKLPESTARRFTPPTPEALGKLFPNLEVVSLIGSGGMGAVYKARQPELDRQVAIKILPQVAENAAAYEQRFIREARALAKLNHPNIVAVFDFGKSQGLFYFVMEYVQGITLREAISGGRLTPQDSLAIVSQLCDSLQFAHEEGVVHRDIKPENILIDQRGRVKVADFGLAKLVGSEAPSDNLTGTQQVMGTMRYMAPEQLSAAKSVDHRADIYSLGVVFYELLTGELPLGWFAPPSKKVGVDVRLDEVVLRTLESEPDRRYQQASELKSAVTRLSAIADPALPPSPGASGGAAGRSSTTVHRLLDITDTTNRRLFLLYTVISALLMVLAVLAGFTSRARPLADQAASILGAALLLGLASVAVGAYAHHIKRRLRWQVSYKGHTIVFDGGGALAERLYLDDGLVRHGGVGVKMEIRAVIKAGEGIGDEIVVWYDARLFSCRCRIVAEERS